MIPNVCISWCQRQARCSYCPGNIEAGTPIVRVFWWSKGEEGKRKWNVKQYYHPQCWIEHGMEYLSKNPYVPYLRHKKSVLTARQQEKRKEILRKKASLEQRRRNLVSDYPDRLLVEARLDRQIAELMVAIAKVGGIPNNWTILFLTSLGFDECIRLSGIGTLTNCSV